MHDADGAGDFEGEALEDDDGVTPLQPLPAPRASASAPPATSTESMMRSPTHAEGTQVPQRSMPGFQLLTHGTSTADSRLIMEAL
eukprot:1234008-Rhodomonas_salina.3